MFEKIKDLFGRQPKQEADSLPNTSPPNPLALSLEWENEKYANFIKDIFEGMDAGTRAHVFVAHYNLVFLLSAMSKVATERGQQFTVEDFIIETAAVVDSYTDEINSRRMSWFLFAAMLARLQKLAHTTPTIKSIGARIWCLIISDLPALKVLLPKNVVWKPDEKDIFDLALSDHDIIDRGLSLYIPAVFSKEQTIKDFASARGIYYWPSTIGSLAIP